MHAIQRQLPGETTNESFVPCTFIITLVKIVANKGEKYSATAKMFIIKVGINFFLIGLHLFGRHQRELYSFVTTVGISFLPYIGGNLILSSRLWDFISASCLWEFYSCLMPMGISLLRDASGNFRPTSCLWKYPSYLMPVVIVFLPHVCGNFIPASCLC